MRGCRGGCRRQHPPARPTDDDPVDQLSLSRFRNKIILFLLRHTALHGRFILRLRFTIAIGLVLVLDSVGFGDRVEVEEGVRGLLQNCK